jgi:orotate phosphoribosyltransferase-like protein
LRILHNLNVKLRKRTKKDYSEDTALCEKIKRLHIEEKKTITEISNELEISWEKVKKHLLASDFEVQRHNNFHKQVDFNNSVRYLYVNKQLRMKDVAKELKCCIAKVQKRLKYLGIKPRNAAQYHSKEKIKQYKRIIYWYNRGLTIPSISKMEKIPKSTIYYILERNNVKMDKRRRENQNQKAIVSMALSNPKKYKDYADRKIEEQEEKVVAKKSNGMRYEQLESSSNIIMVT